MYCFPINAITFRDLLYRAIILSYILFLIKKIFFLISSLLFPTENWDIFFKYVNNLCPVSANNSQIW